MSGNETILPGRIFARLSIAAASLLMMSASGKTPAENSAPTPPAATNPATVPIPALPADLGRASLQVSALDTLYEFDLSLEQLKTVKAAAAKTVSTKHRTAAKANPELANSLKDFQTGLLSGKDGAVVAKLRAEVMRLAADVDLDDEVQPTPEALAQAAGVRKKFKASQIAAFLALHADQVADPGELLASSLESAREMKAEGGAKGGAGSAAEVQTLISETGTTVGYLVFGTDEAKAKALAGQATAWLKAGLESGEKEFASGQAARDDKAKAMIGEIDPMAVLGHWLDLQVAVLLSNPELPEAVDATVAAKAAEK